MRLLRGRQGQEILEVGCAGSFFLPYFADYFGLRASGLDYSEVGCERLRAQLERWGIPAEVVCADLFDPPADLRGRFDVVTSFGVIEHFEDPGRYVRALTALLKPGGLVITTLPNLVGLNGWLMRTFNPGLYALHVPLDRERVARAHAEAGLTVRDCRYFMSVNFGVLNETTLKSRWRARLLGLFHRVLRRVSFTAWWFEERILGGSLPASRWLSPYLLCVAEQHEGSQR